MDCDTCDFGYAYSGNSRVCEYYLLGGDTVFIKNGSIEMPCPLENDKKSKLEIKLTDLLNSISKENDSNTPDYILAQFLVKSLHALNEAISCRDNHNNSKSDLSTGKINIIFEAENCNECPYFTTSLIDRKKPFSDIIVTVRRWWCKKDNHNILTPNIIDPGCPFRKGSSNI
jgi:hypothetical protein